MSTINALILAVADAIERAAADTDNALQIIHDTLDVIDGKGAVGVSPEVVYGAVEVDEDGELVSDGESYRDRLWVASGEDQMECIAWIEDGELRLSTETSKDAGWTEWAREAVGAVLASNGPGRPTAEPSAWEWLKVTTEARGGSVPSTGEVAAALELSPQVVRRYYRRWTEAGKINAHGTGGGRTHSRGLWWVPASDLAISECIERVLRGSDVNAEIEESGVGVAQVWILDEDGDATHGYGVNVRGSDKGWCVVTPIEPECGEEAGASFHIEIADLADCLV